MCSFSTHYYNKEFMKSKDQDKNLALVFFYDSNATLVWCFPLTVINQPSLSTVHLNSIKLLFNLTPPC